MQEFIANIPDVVMKPRHAPPPFPGMRTFPVVFRKPTFNSSRHLILDIAACTRHSLHVERFEKCASQTNQEQPYYKFTCL